jgi:hypothetical protein
MRASVGGLSRGAIVGAWFSVVSVPLVSRGRPSTSRQDGTWTPTSQTLIHLQGTFGGRIEAARAIEMADGPFGFLPAVSLRVSAGSAWLRGLEGLEIEA